MTTKEPYITGSVMIKSNLTIEQIGQALSKHVFSGIPFEGKEQKIYDEVPAIFIRTGVLGFSIILQGYPVSKSEGGYWLEIIPDFTVSGADYFDVKIDNYLKVLLKEKLKSVENVEVV